MVATILMIFLKSQLTKKVQNHQIWVTGVYTPRGGLHQSHIRGCQLEPGALHPQGGSA